MSDEETATDLLEISTSWPTIKDGLEADYRVLVTALWGKHCTTASSCYSPMKERLLGYFNQYIATYVASECVAGGKLTTKGFRDFLDETVDPVKLRVLAGDTLQSMNALAEGRIKAGLTPVTDVCQRLILYPESGLEIALAQGLYSVIGLPNVPLHLRDAFLAGLDSDFGGWLLVEDNQQKTIFQWFCNSRPARCGELLP